MDVRLLYGLMQKKLPWAAGPVVFFILWVALVALTDAIQGVH